MIAETINPEHSVAPLPEDLPSSQEMHPAEPEFSWNLPIVHSEQTARPGLSVIVPGSQSVHSDSAESPRVGP
jgi:hypothetical protein